MLTRRSLHGLSSSPPTRGAFGASLPFLGSPGVASLSGLVPVGAPPRSWRSFGASRSPHRNRSYRLIVLWVPLSEPATAAEDHKFHQTVHGAHFAGSAFREGFRGLPPCMTHVCPNFEDLRQAEMRQKSLRDCHVSTDAKGSPVSRTGRLFQSFPEPSWLPEPRLGSQLRSTRLPVSIMYDSEPNNTGSTQ